MSATTGEPLQDMGQMWLDCFVLPQLETLRTSRVFHQRLLALHMILLLIKEQVRGCCAFGCNALFGLTSFPLPLQVVQVQDVRFNILVNIALTLAEDKVANVRLALCEVLDDLRGGIVNHALRYRREEEQKKSRSCSGVKSSDDLCERVDDATAAAAAGGDRDGGDVVYRGYGSCHSDELEDGSNTALALRALRRLLTDSDRDVQRSAALLLENLDADYHQYTQRLREAGSTG